jgi:hypothetical protein
MPSKAKSARIYKNSGDFGESDAALEVFDVDDFDDDYNTGTKRTNNKSSKSLQPRQYRPSTKSSNIASSASARDDTGLTSDEDFERRYDLEPVDPLVVPPTKLVSRPTTPPKQQPPRKSGAVTFRRRPSFSVDPWEAGSPEHDEPGSFPTRYVCVQDRVVLLYPLKMRC